jgi:hypothetical protein
MKKIILLSLACISYNLFAQKSFFGVDAGVNVANQRTVYPYPQAFSAPSAGTAFLSNTIKPTFGLFYQLGFSETLSLRANAKFMGMGYKAPNHTIEDLEIDYLTFPVALQYAANKHFTVNAGPYLSFTLGGTRINNEIITKTYHRNDFGFFVGTEHDVYRNFALAVNYYIGTKNIWLADHVSWYSIKYTNRALQFTLIYKFKKLSKS